MVSDNSGSQPALNETARESLGEKDPGHVALRHKNKHERRRT